MTFFSPFSFHNTILIFLLPRWFVLNNVECAMLRVCLLPDTKIIKLCVPLYPLVWSNMEQLFCSVYYVNLYHFLSLSFHLYYVSPHFHVSLLQTTFSPLLRQVSLLVCIKMSLYLLTSVWKNVMKITDEMRKQNNKMKSKVESGRYKYGGHR